MGSTLLLNAMLFKTLRFKGLPGDCVCADGLPSISELKVTNKYPTQGLKVDNNFIAHSYGVTLNQIA